jgi:hypothetical protein
MPRVAIHTIPMGNYCMTDFGRNENGPDLVRAVEKRDRIDQPRWRMRIMKMS